MAGAAMAGAAVLMSTTIAPVSTSLFIVCLHILFLLSVALCFNSTYYLRHILEAGYRKVISRTVELAINRSVDREGIKYCQKRTCAYPLRGYRCLSLFTELPRAKDFSETPIALVA
jgi:hypothetical protein